MHRWDSWALGDELGFVGNMVRPARREVEEMEQKRGCVYRVSCTSWHVEAAECTHCEGYLSRPRRKYRPVTTKVGFEIFTN